MFQSQNVAALFPDVVSNLTQLVLQWYVHQVALPVESNSTIVGSVVASNKRVVVACYCEMYNYVVADSAMTILLSMYCSYSGSLGVNDIACDTPPLAAHCGRPPPSDHLP